MLAFFDVVSWGYGAYVTLEVTSPSGKQLQSFVSESEGRVDFVAAEDGEYNFCFKNAYSETELSFWINTETDIGLSDVAKEGTSACSSGGGAGGKGGRRPMGTARGWGVRRSTAHWNGGKGHAEVEPAVRGGVPLPRFYTVPVAGAREAGCAESWDSVAAELRAWARAPASRRGRWGG